MTPINNRSLGYSILEDLSVRASDILQANGVIWVEGISDVIYIRRWIELYCEETGRPVPAEGTDYAFIEYGGKCLSHYAFAPSTIEKVAATHEQLLLAALSLSPNALVVMDSDMKNAEDQIGRTKIQVAEAARSWITAGREIENYLPNEIAESVFGASLGKYENASRVYRRVRSSIIDKKKSATEAAALITRDNWKRWDLEKRIGEVVDEIERWNRT